MRLAPRRPTRKVRVVALWSAIGLIVGSVAPWAEDDTASVSGLNGDGRWLLIAGVLALGCCVAVRVTRRASAFAVLVAIGAAGVAVSLYNAKHASDIDASVGWGLWVSTVSSAIMTLAGFGAVTRAPRVRDLTGIDYLDEDDDLSVMR